MSQLDTPQRLDELLAEVTDIIESDPTQTEAVYTFINRIQQVLQRNERPILDDAGLNKADPDLAPSRTGEPVRKIGISNSPSVLNNQSQNELTKSADERQSETTPKPVVQKHSSRTQFSAIKKEKEKAKDKEMGNEKGREAKPPGVPPKDGRTHIQQRLADNSLPNTGITNTRSAQNVPTHETLHTPTFRKPMRKLYPTGAEWQEFENLYKMAKETDTERLGAVLIDLPATCREWALPKGTKNLSMVGGRSQIKYSKDGYMIVGFVGDGKYRLDTQLDMSQPVPNTPFPELIKSFETSGETLFNAPIYAIGKDVHSSEYRRFYDVPQSSAIFPLNGNQLENTKVGIAGIHTPWMYVSESFGTCFTLHVEDFHLTSLNVVLAGAPKIWTVISPRDSSKLECYIRKELGIESQCHQFVRHTAIYITSAKLDELEIQYTQFEQRPGQVVMTFPGAYHQGFNAGLNISEAINYGDRETLARVSECSPCSKASCGTGSGLSHTDFETLLPGGTQTLIGISVPWDKEKLELKKGRKRKRTIVGGTDGRSSPTPSNPFQQVENMDEIKKQQMCQGNLTNSGLPVIDLVRIYSKLVATTVEVDKTEQSISHQYAAVLVSMILECGSPSTCQQLCMSLQALRHRPPPQIIHPDSGPREDRLQRLAGYVKCLDYFEGSQLIATIATRYNLALLAKEFDNISGPSQKKMTATYKELIQTLNPTLLEGSSAFRKLKDQLKSRMSFGRRWHRLVTTFGMSIVALIPYDIPRGTCNSYIHSMPLVILEIWIESMKSEQGPWIQKIGPDVGEYIIQCLNTNFAITDEPLLPLELANPSEIARLKYRSRDLANLCVQPRISTTPRSG